MLLFALTLILACGDKDADDTGPATSTDGGATTDGGTATDGGTTDGGTTDGGTGDGGTSDGGTSDGGTETSPWDQAVRTGYNFNSELAYTWDGGEDFEAKDGDTVICTASSGTWGNPSPSGDCTDCVARWELNINYSAGTGACGKYGFDPDPDGYTRQIGYAPTTTWDGTDYTEVLMAYDPALSAWRPIGDMSFGSPYAMSYRLWSGEPTWER